MNLAGLKWTEVDARNFEKFLEQQKVSEKVEWTTKIVCTKNVVFATPASKLKTIAVKISKGDFLSFLNQKIYSSYEATLINGFLIAKIKDFEVMKKYLLEHLKHLDCWATCDGLVFDVKYYQDELFSLAKSFLKSPETFTRRTGLRIFFKYINKNYLPQIFEEIISLKSENEYYVNMIVAWFLCECFIKERTLTLEFLGGDYLNDFTINKTVQKCRDSYRVSKEDKEMLLELKK